MKKIILFFFIAIISLSSLYSSSISFNPDYYVPNTIIICFEQDVIGNIEGIMDYEIENGVVRTGLSEFDILSEEFKFVELKQMFNFITNLDWNDNGIYLQNIYRVILEDNKNIEEALSALSKTYNIIYAEYEGISRVNHIPNDPLYSQQWHHPRIDCPETWDWTTGNDEVIIGIVDSGIMWNHPDLQDNIWVNEAELNSTTYGGNTMTINWAAGTVSGGNGYDDDGNGKVDDCIGWNFFYNNNSSYQGVAANDHGTHVGGCAAAIGDNGIGVTGVNMNAKLLVSTHRGASPGESLYYTYDGIIYCAQTGADIINCSFGGPGSSVTANAVVNSATNLGALVVGSAGNESWSNDIHPSYPNDATNCLCVASTDQYDVKAYFSNWGSSIDVCAPGVSILSTVIGGDGYTTYQGTSMSAPIVAGLCALVLTSHPELEPLELKARVELTTDDIYDVNPTFMGLLGSGRINAFQAVMYDLIPKLTIENFNFYEFEGDGDGVPNPGEICNLEINIWNNWFTGGLWAQANDVTVTLTTDEPEVTIINGTESFEIPIIYQAGSYWNYDTPFQITTPDDTNIQEIIVTVTITANQETDYPYEISHDLVIYLAYEQSGWPYNINSASNSSAALVDIYNNGNKQVVFGDYEGLLHVVNPDATEDAPFPVNVGGSIGSAIAVADINDDSYKDMVGVTESGTIFAVDHEGNDIFTPYTDGNQMKGNPIIADVDGNGSLEIIVFTFVPASKAIVLNADGTDYPNFPVTLTSGGVLSSPAVGDLNSDGFLEIIAVSLTGAVYAISTNTGENIEGWPVAIGMNSWNGPIVTNIDEDEDPEVLAATGNGNVFAFNHDGTVIFEKTTGSLIKTSIVTGDLDNNGSIDIVFITNPGDLYVIDNQGNDIGDFPFAIGENVESTPILADMDNNGTIDIIFGDNSGYLHSIDITGNETINFPISLGSSLKISPAIGDIDGDEDAEIVIPNQFAYVVIDYKRNVPNSNIAWSCFKRNPMRTGNAFDPTTGTSEQQAPNPITFLGNNYPNPFNPSGAGRSPSTKISFSLNEMGPVNLGIYNIRGQLIKTLISEIKAPGVHFAEWNGKDSNNKSVGSGIYLYKLQTQSYSKTKKMMLLK